MMGRDDRRPGARLVHTNDAEWGQWNAIFSASFIPTFAVFGILCRRFPLKTLLFWGTLVAIPQISWPFD